MDKKDNEAVVSFFESYSDTERAYILDRIKGDKKVLQGISHFEEIKKSTQKGYLPKKYLTPDIQKMLEEGKKDELIRLLDNQLLDAIGGQVDDSLLRFLIMTHNSPRKRAEVYSKIGSLTAEQRSGVYDQISSLIGRGNISAENIELLCSDANKGIVLTAPLSNGKWITTLDDRNVIANNINTTQEVLLNGRARDIFLYTYISDKKPGFNTINEAYLNEPLLQKNVQLQEYNAKLVHCYVNDFNGRGVLGYNHDNPWNGIGKVAYDEQRKDFSYEKMFYAVSNAIASDKEGTVDR